jgi:zinc transporter ZupT
MSVQKAVAYNIVSSVLSFIGMAVGVWIGEYEAASHWIYAFTAGTFLYIGLVDLVSICSAVLKVLHLKIFYLRSLLTKISANAVLFHLA